MATGYTPEVRQILRATCRTRIQGLWALPNEEAVQQFLVLRPRRSKSADGKEAALMIDLESVQKIGSATAKWELNAPAGYAVETSKDGLFWDRMSPYKVAGPGKDQVTFPTTEARYGRLAGLTPTQGFATMGVWSLGVHGIPNAAAGTVATSSGIETPSFPAHQAFDGNAATRWSANYSDRRWIAAIFSSL
ncbi:hypothetical protein [Specibacter sp. NPDC078709]|uniref:galactose-binding domain-containing protein n=1 Tax=Specibacter sp. NPDC078709 TaxID=3154364 RepID=UPI003433A962